MKKIIAVTFAVFAFAGVSTASAAMMGADTTMKSDTMMKADSTMMADSDLMMGSKGESVITLQTFLESKGHLMMPNGVAKGYFGNLTKMALKKYQMEAGVKASGYFGPLTRAAMQAMMGTKGDTMMKKDAMMHNDSMMKEEGVMVGGALMVASRDIVDNAVLAKNVTTVVAAVQAAGLVDTLKGAGPFTVFAPNNAAFDKLPAGTVTTLLKAENKAQLTDILTYHVVAGRYKAADLTDGLMLKTVEGKSLKFTRDASGKLWINGSAMVETADVISRNGVTHVIDTVLMPTN